MRILAIDTTERACSAALSLDGQCREKFEVVPRRHSQVLLPMVDRLLADAGLRLSDLDALAFARGPGSFTGVRIAAAVAQGLAMAAGLPVVPVSSLLALAQGAAHEAGAGRVLAVFDARMQEVYWLPCRRDGGLMVALGEERVGPPAAVTLPEGGDWLLAGSGVAPYGDLLAEKAAGTVARAPEAMVHAAEVARLAIPRVEAGEVVPAVEARPVYLRQQVARKMTASDR